MYSSAVATMGTLRATAKVCVRCGRAFLVTRTEQDYSFEPKRCMNCRRIVREERGKK